MYKTISDINIETEEGKMFLAAIAKITTESQTNKTPNQVLEQIQKLRNKMFNPNQIEVESEEVKGNDCDNCYSTGGYYLGGSCPKCGKPFRSVRNYNNL